MLRCHFTPFRKHVFSILPAKGVMEVLFSMGENGGDDMAQGPGCPCLFLPRHSARAV